MKRNIRVILLVVFALTLLSGVYAQTQESLTPDQLRARIQEERARYIEAIVQFAESLPTLRLQDPSRARLAVQQYSDMLDRQLSFSEDYRPFSPKETAFLKGHLRAFEQEPGELYNYYKRLIADSQILDDQPNMYYLLYLMQVQQTDQESRRIADLLLLAMMESSSPENIIPAYSFLWSDMTAAKGDSAAIEAKLASFRQTRNLITNEVVPKKAEIHERIKAIPNDIFFADPNYERSLQLQSEITSIKSDLINLYNSLLSMEGIIKKDEIARLRDSEFVLLDSLKACVNYHGSLAWKAERLTASRAVVDSLKVSLAFFNQLAERIESAFKTTELQYSSEYINYLDIEVEILMGFVGASILYAHAVEVIDTQLEYHPEWEDAKKQELRNRRTVFYNESVRLLNEFETRYTAYTTNNPWKSHYDTVISNYVLALREKLHLESGIIEAEYAINELDRRRFAAAGMPVIPEFHAGAIDENYEIFDSQYTYLTLQRDFRLLQYKDAQRLANVDQMSYDENAALLASINQGKEDYIRRAEQFILQYPEFQGFMQPTGDFLITNADMYYNIAEFQYSLDPNYPQNALMNYRKALSTNPNFILADRVKYNIGFIELVLTSNNMDQRRETFFANNPTAVTYDASLRFKTSDFSSTISAFRSVIEDYPNSPLKEESMLHLGTIYFLLAADSTNPEANYNLALSYLNPLVANPESDRYYEALYQRGVIHMNFGGDNGYRLAISDYQNLLRGIKQGRITDPALIQDYQDAAVDNIAFALIALDGSEFEATAQGAQLEAFLEDYEDESVIARIYDKAAAQKNTELNSPLQARDFLMAKIRRLPKALDNPANIYQTVILYNQFYTELDATRQRNVIPPLTYRFNQYQYLIENYGKTSEWYNTNKNNAAIATQLAIIDSAYVAVERRLVNNFVAAMNDSALNHEQRQAQFNAYKEHIRKWAEFEELHAGQLATRRVAWDNNVTDFSTLLADKSDNPKDWMEAYTSLTQFNDRNIANPNFRYEGLAFRFAQSIYDDMNGKFSDPAYQPLEGMPQSADSLYAMYDRAALRFISAAMSPQNANADNLALANQTLINLGDMNAQRGKTALARTYYLKLLEQEATLPDITKRDLYIKLADLASVEKQYRQSEDWYRKALLLATDNNDRALLQNQVALQIQSNFETAEQNGDFLTAAQEYLRMSEEFKSNNPPRYIGYQNLAQEAFIKAGRPQSAIDILMQLATDRTDKAEVYALHYKAWTLADSLMNDGMQAQRIKDSFVSRYPDSNESFTLQLLSIESMKNNPQTRAAAAEQYIALYEKVKNRQIDAGPNKPEDIYLWGINIYIQDNVVSKRNEHFVKFIDLYPNNSSSIVFMESLADYYWAQGDTLTYERYAKDIYRKDRTKNARYSHIANIYLGKIAYEFDSAYINKNWTQAFAKRDEFIRLETEYKRQGLTFNSQSAYDAFARADTEYRELQAKLAFFRRYDSQLDNIERTGFLSKSPGVLITLNANTTWRNHLFGGRPNRVAALQPVVTAEVNRVVAVLNSAGNYTLDNPRRLRALDLIGRINEHAANAIKAQVEQYFAIANEFAPYKNRNQMSQEEYDELVANLRAYATQFSNEYLNQAYSIYLQTYNTYYMAGYRDNYSIKAKNKLAEWNVEPQYQKDEFVLGSGWSIRLEEGTPSGTLTNVTSPQGIVMGKMTIPAGNAAILKRSFNSRIAPDFGFVQMVYPYDATIKVNTREVEPSFVPADTLTAGDAMTTRYALMIEGSAFVDGANEIELRFPNESTEALPLMLSLQMYTSSQRLADAVPVETVKYVTDTQWKVVTANPETDQEIMTPAIPATSFGIEKSKILDMESTTAQPIWTIETPEAKKAQVVFEYTFDINTVFKEGLIDMVAPSTATVVLNGVVIATAEEFYYETQPLVYYPNRISIDGQNIVNGRNTLRFIVDNATDFRGFMAEITIKKTVQE